MGITIEVLCCVTKWNKKFIPWSVQSFAGMNSIAPKKFLSQSHVFPYLSFYSCSGTWLQSEGRATGQKVKPI